jgi:hypothetical protein
MQKLLAAFWRAHSILPKFNRNERKDRKVNCNSKSFLPLRPSRPLL